MWISKSKIRNILADKRVRFIITGAMNTGFSFIAYSLLVIVGVVPHLAVVIMYPLSILHSYLWNKFFTFRTKKRSGIELVRFVLVYLIIFGINYSVVYVLTSVFYINPFIAGLVALAVSTILSYLGHSRFTFSDKSQ